MIKYIPIPTYPSFSQNVFYFLYYTLYCKLQYNVFYTNIDSLPSPKLDLARSCLPFRSPLRTAQTCYYEGLADGRWAEPESLRMPKLPFGSVLVGRRVLDPDSDPTGGILVENEPAQVRNHRNKKIYTHWHGRGACERKIRPSPTASQ